MIDSACLETLSHSKIKVEEKGRSAVFINADGAQIMRIRVDGCVIVGKTASDFVLSKKGCWDIIVELKGGDVEHAVEQIRETAKHWTANKLRQGSLCALVVCRKYPSFDTRVQRHAASLIKDYKAKLKVVSHNREYCFKKDFLLT